MDYIDHYLAAKANIIQQYGGKPVIDAIIRAATNEMNVLDQSLVDLFDKRPLAVATGAQLDGWGAILNVARNGLVDADYRAVLYSVIAGYNSSGTAEELIALLDSLCNPALPVEILEYFPAEIVLQVDGPVLLLTQAEIGVIVHRSKAAGVRISVVISPTDPYFGFAEDVSPNVAGFDDGYWSDVF